MFGAVPEQGLQVLVHTVMAVDAEQGQVVDVGLAAIWGFPGEEMMRLAAGVVGGAQHAALIADDQGNPLLSGDEACCPALPQRLAGFGQQDGGMVADATEV